MTEEELEHLYTLQGRILACERLNLGLLTLLAVTLSRLSNSEPAEMLRTMEQKFMGSLQHLDMPEGPESDTIWEAMGESLRVTFDNARKRLSEGED